MGQGTTVLCPAYLMITKEQHIIGKGVSQTDAGRDALLRMAWKHGHPEPNRSSSAELVRWLGHRGIHIKLLEVRNG